MCPTIITSKFFSNEAKNEMRVATINCEGERERGRERERERRKRERERERER